MASLNLTLYLDDEPYTAISEAAHELVVSHLRRRVVSKTYALSTTRYRAWSLPVN